MTFFSLFLKMYIVDSPCVLHPFFKTNSAIMPKRPCTLKEEEEEALSLHA